MRLRLLLSFLLGTVFFTALPIYAPFALLQTTDLPPFLLGLGAGVVAGAVLTLSAGTVWRGVLLVSACAFVGASLFLLGYAIPRFGPLDSGEPMVLAITGTYVVLVIPIFLYLVLPAVVGVGLAALARSLVAKSHQGKTPPQ